MPELPEVETVARRLARDTTGRKIQAVELRDPKLRTPGWETLPGHRIDGVTRLGKQVVLHLRRPRARAADRWLLVHLRMTGQLWWQPALAPEAPHLRGWLVLDRGVVCYADLRRFGRWSLTADLAGYQPAGLDPLAPEFTPAALAALVKGSRQPLKPWLLRQDRLVGVGNIYASEICHRARLHPARPAGALTRAELRRLHRATLDVLTHAIEASGTIFYAIEAGRQVSGTFREALAVYGQEGAPCRRCGTPLARQVQAARSTYLCPRCQPPDRPA